MNQTLATEISADSSKAVQRRDISVFIAGMVAVSTLLIWLLFIYNRFLTPHEGWFSYYGLLMKSGKVPYRDFYFFTQPVHLLIARIISEFGDKLIYFREYGVFDRICLTAVYYYLLSRQFSAAAAVCGTVASSFFFLAYPTDALFSYLYTCLLFLLVSLACLYKAWTSEHHRTAWMFMAGISTSLCFFTKQSNGLLAIVGIAFTIALISDSIRRAVRDLVPYSLGLVAGTVPFVAWLVYYGAWQSYVNQVFVGAASSKGGLNAVLFGFLSRQANRFSVLAFFILLVGAFILRKRIEFVAAPGLARQIPQWWAVGAVAISTLAGIIAVGDANVISLILMKKFTEIGVNVVLYTVPLAFVIVLWRRFLKPGWPTFKGYEVPVALLVASLYWTYSCGMSWNVAEQSTIPSLGLLLSFLYDRIEFRRSRVMSIVVVAAAIFFTQLGIWHKWNLAFSWEGWFEKMSTDKAQSHWEPIADFKIARGEAAIYDAILDDISKYTKPGEPVLTLFTIPVFNFVGQHWQPGFAPVHYWDVCPDNIAVKDALRIKETRPKIIVELELEPWVWKEHDQGWRGGRLSGQRQLQDVVDGLTSSGDYRKIRSFPTPSFGMHLVEWLRVR